MILSGIQTLPALVALIAIPDAKYFVTLNFSLPSSCYKHGPSMLSFLLFLENTHGYLISVITIEKVSSVHLISASDHSNRDSLRCRNWHYMTQHTLHNNMWNTLTWWYLHYNNYYTHLRHPHEYSRFQRSSKRCMVVEKTISGGRISVQYLGIRQSSMVCVPLARSQTNVHTHTNGTK